MRLFLFSLLFFTSCVSLGDKTKLDIDDFSTPQERIEALKQVLNEPTDFSDAEFELFNVNGFPSSRSVSAPGASSWEYKFAIRIQSNQFRKWMLGRNSIDQPNWDMSWMDQIIKQRKASWTRIGSPEYFGSSEDQLIYFPQSQILFRRSIAN